MPALAVRGLLPVDQVSPQVLQVRGREVRRLLHHSVQQRILQNHVHHLRLHQPLRQGPTPTSHVQEPHQ
eukprot:CAMPEP_0185788000 /NCGR_PEP_ID=MMETSP1174-20130828/143713_1 /TAXON_ID=35687 /ORGANISM="Dictyocha speculum, Strain CCMP1381" /LENGTH=68 /DNA_ID=CAMNT_0028481445 /DNA_START=100 /DNA_END=303 /DNA_ORIENTATION=-